MALFTHREDGLQEDLWENGENIKSSGVGDWYFWCYNEDGERTER